MGRLEERSGFSVMKKLYTAGRQLNFLIADDNDVNLLVAQKTIEKFKGICRCVTDGYQVLDAIEKDSFDIILLDIQMANLDGIATMELIRKSGNKIPIIVISAFASASEEKVFIQNGASAYLAKPYYPEDLLKAIDSIVPLDDDYQSNASSNSSNILNSKPNKENTLSLKFINFKDLKTRLAPTAKSIAQLIDIYGRRATTLDNAIEESIKTNDVAKLRETVHSIKGLTGMISANETWELSRSIEKLAADGDMASATEKLPLLRQQMTEINNDLKEIQKFLS